MRGGRKLKAVIPGGSSVPVVPGDDHAEDQHGLRLAARRRARRSAPRAVIVMDETTCMVRVLERMSRFYTSESCGQCTPCREGTGWMNRMLKRILAGAGRQRGPRAAGRRRQPHRGPHHLRARRCRGLAGAELPQALPARVRIHDRPRRPQHRRRPRRGARPEQRTTTAHEPTTSSIIEVNGVPVKAPQGRDDHPASRTPPSVYVPRFCYHEKLPVAANCRMCLVEVEKAPKPHAGLRHAGDRGHEGLHQVAEGHRARRRRRWNSC